MNMTEKRRGIESFFGGRDDERKICKVMCSSKTLIEYKEQKQQQQQQPGPELNDDERYIS